MSVLEIVLVQLLLACAIALMCTLQLCLHAFALRAGNCVHVHFTYRWNTSLARGSVVQIGSRHRHVGCCPDTRFEDTPFEMLIKCILSWGILSTSLVVCENNLIRTRSNIIGFVRFVLVQPIDKACSQFFQPCRCLEWSVDNSRKLHCASTCSRIDYLEHERSTF